jgi:RNA polymerase sigma factor (sigma-70 family)
MSRSALAAGLRHLRRQLALQQSSDDSDEQLLQIFLSRREESAFAALVRRHGPMVLHVCRRVLGHEQDAEDAFQATFLVLALQAARLRKKSSLASWLHGTAHRIALKAKQAAARRRKYEGQTPPRPNTEPSTKLLWDEVRVLLDEEIARLPEKYRSVFVLFYLEECSREETGRRLGLKEGTVASRLAEARKRLSQRLSRRGVELTAVLGAIALAAQPASAVSAGLAASTIQAALAAAKGEGLAGIATASVAELVQCMTTALMASKAKAVALTLIVVALLGGAGMWLGAKRTAALSALDPPKTASPPSQANPHAERGKQKPPDALVLRGRVLDPDNKPVAGAKLYLPRWPKERPQDQGEAAVVQCEITDKEGRFRLEISREDIPPDRSVSLLAAADNLGLNWVDVSQKDVPGELTLRLVKDVPIRGRLLSTEGKPVVGVPVTPVSLAAFERLDDFLFFFQRERKHFDELPGTRWLRLPLNSMLRVKPTDKDGRFEIAGIGVERLVGLEVKSPAIIEDMMLVVTRENFDSKEYLKNLLRSSGERVPPLFGLSFEHVVERAEANRAIEGTVREAGSSRPVAGAVVQALGISTRTDAAGRYRLVGLRKTQACSVQVAAPENQPLIGCYMRVKMPAEPAQRPVRADVELMCGVPVTGRVYDKKTGKGVRSSVHFAPLPENKTPKIGELDLSLLTSEDGRFRLVTVPGSGVLLARVLKEACLKVDGVMVRPYKPAEFDETDRRRVQMTDRVKPARAFVTADGTIRTLDSFEACKVLDVKENAAEVKCDLALDPGKTLTLNLRDSDGKPLTGAVAIGTSAEARYAGPLKSNKCQIYALDPANPRLVVFFHEKQKLAALLTLRGDEKEPTTVRLAPAGVLTGRVLDEDGQPLAGAEIYSFYATPPGKSIGLSSRIAGFTLRDLPLRTDLEGRFRLDTVVPGLKLIDVRLLKGKQIFVPKTRLEIGPLRSGETLDLGDIRTKPRQP